jgi:hypothetical protein
VADGFASPWAFGIYTSFDLRPNPADLVGEAVLGDVHGRVHAYVLMANHSHLLLEMPEANLVAGMKRRQGTYTPIPRSPAL